MKLKSLATAAALAVLAAPAAASAAQIVVTPSVAPNAFGSSYWSAWETNATGALHDGDATRGNSTLPSYYKAQANVTPGEAIVTSFPSWKGYADPGTVFGPNFANEYGTRLTFGLWIDGEGTQFSISQLSFTATSDDVGDGLGFGFGVGSYNYGSGYWGVLKGPDNTLWTPDDIFITGGPNTQLVDGLVGRGSGNSFWPLCGGCTTAQEQAAIDALTNDPTFPRHFSGTYTLGAFTGTGVFNFIGVPEPASWAMMLMGFGALGGLLRLNRRSLATRAAVV